MNKIVLMLIFTTLVLADVGKITVLKGDAYIERNIDVLKAYNSMKLLEQDIVETEKGRLQMHFNDNTVISMGKESRFVIREYIYTQDTQNVIARFKVEKGFVKTISGLISKVAPNLFTLETSVVKITPHGTIWSVDVNDEREIYKVLDGKIALVFKDKKKRVEELLAGEVALIKKNSNGKIISYKKTKLLQSSVDSQYEDNIKKDAAIIHEDKMINSENSCHGNNPTSQPRMNPDGV